MSSDANARAIELIQSFMPGNVGRKPANIPALTDSNGQNLPRYLVEKITGLRRENGAMKLKRLTAKHLGIIGRHLEGKSLEQVAQESRVTISTVSRVLNDPLAVAILQRVYTNRESELQALGGKALESVRRSLEDKQPVGVQLRGVTAFTKLREVMLPKDKGSESAEDVIARMLANSNIVGNNIQINIEAKK